MDKQNKKFLEEVDEVVRKQKLSEEAHADDWVIEANKLFEFKKYLDTNPGITRYELAKWGPLENDYDFRKAISFLKFNGEIYEDEEGFFYVKNRYTPAG